MVKIITDANDIPQDKIVIIDFFAEWCGPCKRIAPIYQELSDKFMNIVFLKIDVDESEKISEAFGITALPTFVVINKGNIFKKLEGADMAQLINIIEEAQKS
jgi:thioredoxin 1